MSEQANTVNGWDRYGELVLRELERLHRGQEDLKKEMSNLVGVKSEVFELKVWSDKVNEVWSPRQMLDAQKDIEKQKRNWTIAIGVCMCVEVLTGLAIAFRDVIF